jgi:Na+/H+ antiporter NhaD/arsenite permease-like protein
VLATNIGSSWTVLGNPIGVLIALRSGLTFDDFIGTAFPVGVVSLLCLIVMVLIWYWRDLPALRERHKVELAVAGVRDQVADAGVRFLEDQARIKDKKLFIGSVSIFVLVIISFIVDHPVELWLGLEPNTLLFATPILGAGVIMLWRRGEAQEYIQRDVDWWTLIFFMFLFAQASCLQYVGLTDRVANSMLNLARSGSAQIPVVLMLWISGFVSSIADNVVVVAGLAPVAQALSAQLGTSAPWWALLFGGCYGGNMTMVGSTANIVALGAFERRTGHLIKLGYWLRIGVLAAVVPMAIGTGVLLIFC